MATDANYFCPTCGAFMQLMANYGQYFMVCPNQNDGKHPVHVVVTSNVTTPTNNKV